MVRLFVPKGEGQSPVAPRSPDPEPAQPFLHLAPRDACMLAGLWTGALSILGKSRPGSFLRTMAFLGPVIVADRVTWFYTATRLDCNIIEKEGVTPKPGKLIEWSRGINMDTCAVVGGIVGLALASTKRPFPGIAGWKRYVGVAQVGWTAGSVGSLSLLFANTPQVTIAVAQKQEQYRKYLVGNYIMKRQVAAQDLPLLLRWHHNVHETWDEYWSGSLKPDPNVSGGLAPPTVVVWLRQVCFEDYSLAGPDNNGAGRTYTLTPDVNKTAETEQHITHLILLKGKYQREMDYVLHNLTQKELDFYQMTQEDEAKDDLRRQLTFLSALAETLYLQINAIEFQITDTNRLQLHAAKQITLPPENPGQATSPQITTAAIRKSWEGTQSIIKLFDDIKQLPQPQKLEYQARLAQFGLGSEEVQENYRKNQKATERLLKEFESQVQKADSQDEK